MTSFQRVDVQLQQLAHPQTIDHRNHISVIRMRSLLEIPTLPMPAFERNSRPLLAFVIVEDERIIPMQRVSYLIHCMLV